MTFPKTLNGWTLKAIENQIKKKGEESEFHDYKEGLGQATCHTICALTNAKGGFVIVGVKDNNGIPIKVTGINPKDLTTRITQSCNDMRPEPNFQVNKLSLPNNKCVAVIEVFEGLDKPYCTEHGDDVRFRIRAKAKNRDMTRREVESEFLKTKEQKKKLFALYEYLDTELILLKGFKKKFAGSGGKKLASSLIPDNTAFHKSLLVDALGIMDEEEIRSVLLALRTIDILSKKVWMVGVGGLYIFSGNNGDVLFPSNSTWFPQYT